MFFKAEKVEKSDQIINWPKPEKVRKSDQPNSPGLRFQFGLRVFVSGPVEELLVDPHGASDRAHTGQAVDHRGTNALLTFDDKFPEVSLEHCDGEGHCCGQLIVSTIDCSALKAESKYRGKSTYEDHCHIQ